MRCLALKLTSNSAIAEDGIVQTVKHGSKIHVTML